MGLTTHMYNIQGGMKKMHNDKEPVKEGSVRERVERTGRDEGEEGARAAKRRPLCPDP